MALRIKSSDLVLMMLVMAIAAMLIVPLPTFLLDMLLVCNLSFSILLLLIGLYVGNSSALFTFPSILLLGTLFRLGLNVASSRLILSQGEAGRVIEAFGTFLIRGEVIVGVIIFAIVTAVNFIVISNGASRVSEVAARFALDALPGKQQMIDNDARAGVISADEASRKREDLRRESQLYGSMDGAMNFVKGDAIAGILIIMANIFGGMYMGLSSGMSFNDAVQTYTVLTVGDGLVTQIPGLLTSICAGVIVTRVSSSERSSLSSDLHLQLFNQPVTLFVTSLILLVLSLTPGLPMVPFLLAALALLGAGVWSVKRGQMASAMDAANAAEGREALGKTSEGDTGESSIVVSLDKSNLYKLYRANVTEYSNDWREFRDGFVEDTGVVLPPVQVRAGELLAPLSYTVSYMGVEMFSGEVPADALFVEMSSVQAASLGLPVLREEEHPASGHRLFWTQRTPAAIAMLKAARIRYFDFLGFISLRIAQSAVQNPEEFVSVTYVHSLLRQIEKKHPGLIEDGFGREFVSVPKLTEVLQELIRQGVSIRDFRSIMESLASYCASSGITTENDAPVDIAEAVHYIRTARRRQIVRRFVGSNPAVPVFSLSPTVEQTFEGASADRWSTSLAMAPELYDALLQGLYAAVRPTLQMGSLPIALLCSREIKEKVISFVRVSGLKIFVTTLDEIDPAFPVMQMGVWEARL
jgi:type III secretion protein V